MQCTGAVDGDLTVQNIFKVNSEAAADISQIANQNKQVNNEQSYVTT